MEVLENIEVNNYSVAEANWVGLGTEYNSCSFYALKEFLDNSFSASRNNFCTVNITLTELQDGMVQIEIEDDGVGIQDVNTLLSIGSLSAQKAGIHNQYGYGIKNALAFFQTNWSKSDWFIQSKTDTLIGENRCIQVRGPYYYPHEDNQFYNRQGIDATVIPLNYYQGRVDNSSGTYIKFTTPLTTFVRMSPFTTSGRPIANLKSAAGQLSQLISQWYSPKIRSGKIRVEIAFKTLANNDYSNLVISYEEYPIHELLKSVEEDFETQNGGKVQIKAKWFSFDRYNTNFLIPSKKSGMVCYVNGVLVDPFIWIDDVFGCKWNGEIAAMVCLVEVEGDKIDCPEISVSKTKFVQNGINYQSLMTFLINSCPKAEISKYSKRNTVQSEKGKISQFVDMISNNPMYRGNLPETEVAIELADGIVTGNECRYDIVQNDSSLVIISEFKKGEINPAAVYQANTYYDLATLQFQGQNVKMILAGESINSNADRIIQTLRTIDKEIKFVSFADLGLPK